MFKYEALIFLAGLLLFFGIFLVLTITQKRKERITINQAVEQADKTQRKRWAETTLVQDLISTYSRMVFKHGPESEEAKAFRFGTENQHLLDDKASLAAFNQIADIIEKNARAMRKG